MSQSYGPWCHHNQGIRGYGNRDSGVVFVGIAPGRQEAQIGRPFVGPSGGLRDAILESVGWSATDTYSTNLVCFRPSDEYGYDRDPDEDEIAGCHNRLDAELRDLNPRVIVTIGALPTEHLTGRKVGSVIGQCLWNEQYNCWVVPSYHPAAVLRGAGHLIHDIWRSLYKIQLATRPEWGLGPAPVIPHIVGSREEAQQVLSSIPRGSIVALDVETGSPHIGEFEDPFVRPMLEFGLCWESDPGDGWVIPTEHAHQLDWPIDTVQWLFHNGQSDTAVMRASLGVELSIDHDTMLLSYIFDERAGVHRLKELAREYCRATFWEEPLQAARAAWQQAELASLKASYKTRTGHMQPNRRYDNIIDIQWYKQRQSQIKGAGYDVVDPRIRRVYNAHDVVNTRRLFDFFMWRLRHEGIIPTQDDREDEAEVEAEVA